VGENWENYAIARLKALWGRVFESLGILEG